MVERDGIDLTEGA